MSIEEMLEVLRKSCEDINVVLVEAELSNQDRVPSFQMEIDDFVKSLRAELPKIIFLNKYDFDLEQLIDEKISDALEIRFEEDEKNNDFQKEVDRIKKIICKNINSSIDNVRLKNKAVFYFAARYTDHVAIRVTNHYAKWAADFVAELDDAVDDFFDGEDSNEQAATNEKRAKIQAAIDQGIEKLMSDNDFRKLKGIPKRQEYVLWKYPNLVPPHQSGMTERIGQNLQKIDANLAEVIKTANIRLSISDKIN